MVFPVFFYFQNFFKSSALLLQIIQWWQMLNDNPFMTKNFRPLSAYDHGPSLEIRAEEISIIVRRLILATEYFILSDQQCTIAFARYFTA